MQAQQVSLIEEIPVEPLANELVASAPTPKQEELGSNLLAKATPTAPRSNNGHAPLCSNCGNITQRAGSCYVCTSCGSTTGCS
jgi:ribonucleoside-diphosphate reductase alpha chain